ncbi:MAG: VOC family protein [Planctomycetota bacterium]
MKFGYTIVYVENVNQTVAFFNEVFELATRFVHESGDYAELETGTTTLAFASHSLGDANFKDGFTRLVELDRPAGVEIALVTEEVERYFSRATSAGAVELAPPSEKPWGQTVAYVKTADGILIELCTPMGG